VVLNAWDSTPSMLDNQYFARLVTQVLYCTAANYSK
jgi:hypothetical protein